MDAKLPSNKLTKPEDEKTNKPSQDDPIKKKDEKDIKQNEHMDNFIFYCNCSI
ncbi:Hypothetical protein KVN_LOCUS95 [uncultured virus]|nr:Hypothetical protein KVN_LOCUS95 [uncultured virus]